LAWQSHISRKFVKNQIFLGVPFFLIFCLAVGVSRGLVKNASFVQEKGSALNGAPNAESAEDKENVRRVAKKPRLEKG
jgi:hypothetical protein